MYSLNNGDYRACCFSDFGIPEDHDVTKPVNAFKTPIEQVWNNNYYKQLRLDMANGVQNPTCKTCWVKESNGEFSHRQKYNSDNNVQDEKVRSLCKNVIASDGVFNDMPRIIQIKIGSLCNLKCIMCNQASSSLIESEVKEWKKENIELPQYIKFIDQYPEDWKGTTTSEQAEILYNNYKSAIENCQDIQLVGGEPLVNPFTDFILKRLIEEDKAKNKNLYFITNLTSLNKKIISQLQKFRYTTISVSWDHVDADKFKYIRFPANYNHFRENFNKLINHPNINVKLSPTFSIFNIFDVEAIFDTFKELSLNQAEFTINPNWVENPKYFSIRYLEDEQKHFVADYIETYLEKNKNEKFFIENQPLFYMFKSIRNMMFKPLSDFDEVVKERTRVLKLYDETRGTDYKKMFPYIKDYK